MVEKTWPGADVVEQGVRDLERGRETLAALLVSMAPDALRSAGIPVPQATVPSPEERLYALLQAECGDGAHSRFNAYLRQLASFLRAARCANP